jgi:hypothetical protein
MKGRGRETRKCGYTFFVFPPTLINTLNMSITRSFCLISSQPL